jgi:hypothetical protein
MKMLMQDEDFHGTKKRKGPSLLVAPFFFYFFEMPGLTVIKRAVNSPIVVFNGWNWPILELNWINCFIFN